MLSCCVMFCHAVLISFICIGGKPRYRLTFFILLFKLNHKLQRCLLRASILMNTTRNAYRSITWCQVDSSCAPDCLFANWNTSGSFSNKVTPLQVPHSYLPYFRNTPFLRLLLLDIFRMKSSWLPHRYRRQQWTGYLRTWRVQ